MGREGEEGSTGVGELVRRVLLCDYMKSCETSKIVKVYANESFKKERLPDPYDWHMLIHKL